MIKIVFDNNIYDQLAKRADVAACIRAAVAAGRLQVLMPRALAEELIPNPPYFGIPDLFPVVHIGNTVARVGVMAAGDSLGKGEVFDAVLARQILTPKNPDKDPMAFLRRKQRDALIVDAANWSADWFVTSDSKLQKRAVVHATRLEVLGFDEFVRRLQVMPARPGS